jgi:hypothetical protein
MIGDKTLTTKNLDFSNLTLVMCKTLLHVTKV